MARGYEAAVTAKPKPKPAFLVKKLEGKRMVDMITFDSKGAKKVTPVERDAGYLVRFPHKGHSIRVTSEEELKALGFDQTIPVLDDEGDVVFDLENDVLQPALDGEE